MCFSNLKTDKMTQTSIDLMEMHLYKTYKEQFEGPIGGQIVFFKNILEVDGIILIIFIIINLDSPSPNLNSFLALGFALMALHP